MSTDPERLPSPPAWYGQVDNETEDRLLADTQDPGRQIDRAREAMAQPEGQRRDHYLTRRADHPKRPTILGTAREDIPAGATVVIDPHTGMIAVYRPDQENP